MKPIDLDAIMARIEKRYLTKALRECDMERSPAARLLGLKRTTFVMRLKRHGLLEAMPTPAQQRQGRFCKNGHEYTEGNTYVITTANRSYKRCKTCVRDRYHAHPQTGSGEPCTATPKSVELLDTV